MDGKSKDVKYMRLIDFSDEVKALIQRIWNNITWEKTMIVDNHFTTAHEYIANKNWGPVISVDIQVEMDLYAEQLARLRLDSFISMLKSRGISLDGLPSWALTRPELIHDKKTGDYSQYRFS